MENTISAYFGEVAPKTDFLDYEYVDASTFFDFGDRELEAGENVFFNISDGLEFEGRIERTVQPAEEAAEEGAALPDTASNTPMMLALSALLVVAGVALLAVRRRKRVNV